VAVTPSDVKAKLPEFTSLNDSIIQLCLDAAERRVNLCAWGDLADDGILYLTGHLLKLREQGDALAAGPVQSERVLSVNASYAIDSSVAASALGSTAYGRYYLDLRSLVFGARKL